MNKSYEYVIIKIVHISEKTIIKKKLARRKINMEKGKKLYRKTDDKVLAGVCSGIAEYFSIDAVAVRLGWVLLSL